MTYFLIQSDYKDFIEFEKGGLIRIFSDKKSMIRTSKNHHIISFEFTDDMRNRLKFDYLL